MKRFEFEHLHMFLVQSLFVLGGKNVLKIMRKKTNLSQKHSLLVTNLSK